MNSAKLLSHFDRISDAPEAIPRLRRFILSLAVRGKLVEQDPRDEPASELLKRIQVEKAQLVKMGKIEEAQSLTAIDRTQAPYEIPLTWEWAPLGETINSHLGGGTPSKSNSAYWDGDIFWASVKDVGKGKYIDETIDRITKAGLANSSSNLIPPGNLVIVTRMGLGKVSINRVPIAINQDLRALSLSSLVSIDYHYNFFKTHGFQGTGLTVKGIKVEELLNIAFPLPPLAEQHRIVAKVEELMALCDRLEAAQVERENRRDRLVASSLNRLNNGADASAFHDHARFYFNHLPRLTTKPERVQQLRQTILNLAVRGKLVPQDPNDEPAAELLKRIQAEKAWLVKDRAIKKLQSVLPIKTSEVPSAIPDNWEWVKIGDLLWGDSQNGYSRKPDDAPDGIPILRISAGTVRRDGIVAEEEHKLIGGVSMRQQEQYELQSGDLLACRFNGNRFFVGRLSLYLGYLGIKPIYPDKLIRLRLLSAFVLPKLVRYFAESSVVRRDIENCCTTTVGNWGISAWNLKEIKIPFPPFAEQHRIVAKVDELMALCDKLEAQLTTAHTESRCLLEAVLHEALGQSA